MLTCCHGVIEFAMGFILSPFRKLKNARILRQVQELQGESYFDYLYANLWAFTHHVLTS